MKGRRAALTLRILFCLGSLLSIIWFAIQYWLTGYAATDAAIINHAGMLRYQTQNTAVIFCMQRLENELNAPVPGNYHVGQPLDTFETLSDTIQSLAGEKAVDEVPMALDEEVKDALKELWKKLQKIQIKQADVLTMTLAEITETIAEINRATLSVDSVVYQASAGARWRVGELLLLNVLRACSSMLWAFMTILIVGRIWQYYFEAFVSLDWCVKGQLALLNSMFDLVIPIEADGEDFKILEANRKLEDLAGMPMKLQSIFRCCGTEEAKSELERLLHFTRSNIVGALADSDWDQRSPFHRLVAWLHKFWWWTLVPPMTDVEMPVAPMIRTSWSFTRAEDQKELRINVELVVTPAIQTHLASNHDALIVAVRLLDPVELSNNPSDVELSIGTASLSHGPRPGGLPDERNTWDATSDNVSIAMTEPRPMALRNRPTSNASTAPRTEDTRETRDTQSTERQSNVGLPVGSGPGTPPPPTIYGRSIPENGSNRRDEEAFARNVITRLQGL
mmetsp:Transcript_64129/g.114064  ORF Transcript_64129/g.114064 Transcript_64129/m.114064 type:complete len:507 (-) Transcript_64129:588-2108(-)